MIAAINSNIIIIAKCGMNEHEKELSLISLVPCFVRDWDFEIREEVALVAT